MKKVLVSLLVVIVLLSSSCSTLFSRLYDYTPIEGTEGKMLEKYDEFQQITWIQHKYFNTASHEPFSLYIGSKGGDSWLRCIFHYSGSSWIFFDKAILIDSNGNKLSWNIENYDKDTEVLSGGSVKERYDFMISDNEAWGIYNLLSKENVRIRLTGKKNKDYTLSDSRKKALIELLEYYHDIKN